MHRKTHSWITVLSTVFTGPFPVVPNWILVGTLNSAFSIIPHWVEYDFSLSPWRNVFFPKGKILRMTPALN